tara:strand:- start:348 stop:1394 length:1047 start_codon:yes stop_codon:yes gene_type:complete
LASVLITGGAGFIGSHMCLEMLNRGFDLYIIDSLVNSSFNSISKVIELNKKLRSESGFLSFNKIDIRDEQKLSQIFDNARRNKNEIKSVIHFAGLKSINESYKIPNIYKDVNVRGTINLLKIMEDNNCFELIFSSSASIYDQFSSSPKNENSIIKPNNPYGETKVEVERILMDKFEREDKWKIISLRYFNPIGAHYTGELGESPINSVNNLFPILCKVALGYMDFLPIYGNDWPTKDGTAIRDFIHIMDLVEGHIEAFKYLKKVESCYENINLGTGKGTTVLELTKTFERINHVNINYEFKKRRKGDTGIIFADASYAKKTLNWQTRLSISDMCKDGWLFNKNFPNGI